MSHILRIFYLIIQQLAFLSFFDQLCLNIIFTPSPSPSLKKKKKLSSLCPPHCLNASHLNSSPCFSRPSLIWPPSRHAFLCFFRQTISSLPREHSWFCASSYSRNLEFFLFPPVQNSTSSSKPNIYSFSWTVMHIFPAYNYLLKGHFSYFSKTINLLLGSDHMHLYYYQPWYSLNEYC